MTDPLDGLVALVVVGVFNAPILAVVRIGFGARESRFLVRTYLLTLILRMGLAVALNITANSAVGGGFWGDSGTYDVAGDLLARRWRGEAAGLSAQTHALSGYGFVYYVASIYYVFGRNQLLVQLLNATIGSITVLVVYAISGRLFGLAVARWATLLMALFPQMLFWSAGMYKDPAVLLCLALTMYALLSLRQALSLGMLATLGAAATGLLALRFYIFYFVALAAIGTFVFGRRGSLVSRLASYVMVALVFALAFASVVEHETLEAQRAFMTLDQMQVTRADQATWGKSAYGTEYDVSTPTGALRALPVGLAYLLFAPFPWALTGVRQMLTLPETLVWYALMPAFVRGLSHSLRHRLRDVLPIVVFAITLTIAYALMQGNVGTAYRQRTQVTMFFFVFMAVGIVLKRQPADESRGFEMPFEVAGLHAAAQSASLVLDHDFVFDDPV